MGIMDEITEEMEGYVCDSLCRYSSGGSMTREEVEGICEDCRLHIYVGGIKKYAGAGNGFRAVRTA